MQEALKVGQPVCSQVRQHRRTELPGRRCAGAERRHWADWLQAGQPVCCSKVAVKTLETRPEPSVERAQRKARARLRTRPVRVDGSVSANRRPAE